MTDKVSCLLSEVDDGIRLILGDDHWKIGHLDRRDTLQVFVRLSIDEARELAQSLLQYAWFAEELEKSAE